MASVVELSAVEHDYLSRQVRGVRAGRAFSKRCDIVLRCSEGLSDDQVASELGVQAQTVGKWRRRFLRHRVDGLLTWSIGDLGPITVIVFAIAAIWITSIYVEVFAKHYRFGEFLAMFAELFWT